MDGGNQPARSLGGSGSVGPRVAGLVVVGLLAAGLLGVRLSGQPLLDPDESKHAEVAREMLVTGRLLRPIVNFEPYDDKPSLFYVLVGACYRLFGVAAAPARLVSVLAGWLTLVAVYWYAARRELGAGLWAALLLASCPFFVGVSRFTNFDALLTATLTGAVLAFARWLETPHRRGLLFASYAFVAFATLVKGPLALALMIAPVAVAAWSGDFRLRHAWAPRAALAAAAMLAAWVLPVAIVAPEYLHAFLWIHNVQRYLVSESLFHPEPIYFFVPVLLIGLPPWSVLLPLAWPAAWRRGPADRFLATYSLWVVVFFSMSTGKLATYVLPAFPALAVVTAAWLTENRSFAPLRGRRALSAVAASMLALAPAAYAGLAIAEPTATSVAQVLVPASLAGALVLGVARRRVVTTATAVAMLAAGMVATSLWLHLAAPAHIARYSSDADLAAIALESGLGSATVAYEVRPYSYLFYARVPVLEQLDDAGYRAALTTVSPVLLLTRERKLAKLRDLVPELRLHELGRNARHVLYRVD